MQINKDRLAEFKFNDVFFSERGDRLISAEQINGDIAYISSTKNNNGIDNYITPPDYMVVYQNAMTLNNSGSVGYCFFHPYKFVASDHCTVIKILDEKIILNNYIALFLKPIIESMKVKYNFAREISDTRLEKEKINLPINDEGNPDWKFMEDYIKELSAKIIFNKNIEKKSQNIFEHIDMSRWKEFNLINIFDNIDRGERLIEIDRQKGETLYFSASDYNNGLTDAISNPLFTKKDSLIYTTFGKCYYVEGEFTASDEISIFKHEKLNLYNGLFIATVINQNKNKYSFGRKAFYNKFSKDIISLPANKEGNVDWEFMEQYIKRLPYSKSL